LTSTSLDIRNYKNILDTCNIPANSALRTSLDRLNVAVNAMNDFYILLKSSTYGNNINMYGRSGATNEVINTNALVDALKTIVTNAHTVQKGAIDVTDYTTAKQIYDTAYAITNKTNPLTETGEKSCISGISSPQCLEQRGNLARKASRSVSKFNNEYKKHKINATNITNTTLNGLNT
jgi:hypothetical protein